MAEVNDRLIVELEARVDKLAAGVAKGNEILGKFASNVAQHAKSAEDSLGRIDFSGALTKVFDSSRLAVLEEGGAKLRVFGSALEPLGPLGLAAAGGIAAFGLAVEQSLKTAEWAEQLKKTAQTLGVTTDQLQLFDFIATATGVPVDKMRESLKGLNTAIGQVQANTARGNTKKIFDALKIEPDDLRRWGDIETILPHVVEAAAALPSTERAGIAKGLHVDPEVLDSLIAARARLADLTAEAERYGVIVSKDVIDRSAEAAEKLKVASDVIDKNLKSAFSDLAPFIANASSELAKFIHLLISIPKDSGAASAKYAIIGALGAVTGDYQASYRAQQQDIARQQAGLMTHLTVAEVQDALNRGTPAPKLVGDKAHKAHAPADRTDEETKAATEALAQATRAAAEAYAKLAGDVDSETRLQLEANDAEATARQASLDAQIQKLLKDKTIEGAVSDQLQAELEMAKTKTEEARLAKEQLIQRNQQFKLEDQVISSAEEIDRYYQEIAGIDASLALTTRERYRIEAADLAHRQKLEREALETRNAHDVAKGPAQGGISQSDADARMASLLDRQAAENRRQAVDQLTPLEKLSRAIDIAAKNANEAFQNIAANGLKTLEDGLVGVIDGTEKLGQVFKRVAAQIIADLIRIQIEKYVIGPLSNVIGSFLPIPAAVGHNAAGTSNWRGGLTQVNEQGGEIMNLPNGTSIVPASVVRNLTNGQLRSGGASVVVQPITYELHSPVVTQDLLTQMEAMNRRSQAAAVATALSISHKGLGSQLRSRALLND
jgi:hypothetical protein